MSKKDLYKATSLSQETIQSIYKWLAKSMTFTTLEDICEGLGVTMSEFLDSKYFGKERKALEKPAA